MEALLEFRPRKMFLIGGEGADPPIHVASRSKSLSMPLIVTVVIPPNSAGGTLASTSIESRTALQGAQTADYRADSLWSTVFEPLLMVDELVSSFFFVETMRNLVFSLGHLPSPFLAACCVSLNP